MDEGELGSWLLRAAIRGGNFNNGANAGVFYLNLNNAPSNSNYNIGFRACNAQDSMAGYHGSISRDQSICALESWSLPKGKTLQKRYCPW